MLTSASLSAKFKRTLPQANPAAAGTTHTMYAVCNNPHQRSVCSAQKPSQAVFLAHSSRDLEERTDHHDTERAAKGSGRGSQGPWQQQIFLKVSPLYARFVIRKSLPKVLVSLNGGRFAERSPLFTTFKLRPSLSYTDNCFQLQAVCNRPSLQVRHALQA